MGGWISLAAQRKERQRSMFNRFYLNKKNGVENKMWPLSQTLSWMIVVVGEQKPLCLVFRGKPPIPRAKLLPLQKKCAYLSAAQSSGHTLTSWKGCFLKALVTDVHKYWSMSVSYEFHQERADRDTDTHVHTHSHTYTHTQLRPLQCYSSKWK